MTKLGMIAARRSLLAALAAMLTATGAPAQTWNAQPGGSLAYQTQYTTGGTFTCGSMTTVPGTTCTATGSSVLFTYGGRSVTLTYHAVSNPLTVTLEQAVRVSLGEVETSFSGDAPFLFPISISSPDPLFYLSLELRQAGDATVGRFFRTGYANPNAAGRSDGRALGLAGGGYAALRTVSPYPPTGLGYGLIFSQVPDVLVPAVNARFGLEATVSLAPEPGTWALLGTGLLAVGGVAARRRRTTA